MRKTEKVTEKVVKIIEKEITTITCDLCGKEEKVGEKTRRVNTISCEICLKDVCFNCRDTYSEDFHADPENFRYYTVGNCCKKGFDDVWEWALVNARRNYDIFEEALERRKYLKEIKLNLI